MPVFATAHMLGSILAGLLVFFIGSGAGVQDFYQAAFIAVGAYAGARFMDTAADKLVTKTKET